MILSSGLQRIEGTAHAVRSAIQYVCIDHRSSHVPMSQKFLDCSNVVTGFEIPARRTASFIAFWITDS